jgi:very-short-patch-repair endonuclease
MRQRLTERARELRRVSTAAERKIWRWLRHRYLGGHKFRRQHPIDSYVLDFYCADLKLCLEIDGGSHDTDASALRDAKRTSYLGAHGVTVVRIRNEHIYEQPDGAWSMIVAAVEEAMHASEHGLAREPPLTLTLSPEGRGD